MPEAHFSMERAKHKVACYIKRQGKGHMDVILGVHIDNLLKDLKRLCH